MRKASRYGPTVTRPIAGACRVWRRERGGTLLRHAERKGLCRLDRVGSRLWDLLAQDGDPQAAMRTLAETYDAPASRLRSYLLDMLSALRQHGLIIG